MNSPIQILPERLSSSHLEGSLETRMSSIFKSQSVLRAMFHRDVTGAFYLFMFGLIFIEHTSFFVSLTVRFTSVDSSSTRSAGPLNKLFIRRSYRRGSTTRGVSLTFMFLVTDESCTIVFCTPSATLLPELKLLFTYASNYLVPENTSSRLKSWGRVTCSTPRDSVPSF